ncbi:IS5 family transposase [Desulfatitalea tepidiphila]|uniref:IS5 family transposase n=1 Tax=Desulfatitalea tepidiphila TaxID=1185843 RepID=UPI001910C2A3|nr:IS5 family transposase [Desulfatitalea tepidiphila]
MELTNEQWKRIEPILLSSALTKDPRGRPARDPREVLNGILWIMRTRAPWKDLPQRYPPYQTCHRRFQQLVKQGVSRRIAQELLEDLNERGKSDITEAFIDVSFAPVKKGCLLSPKTKRDKGTKIMAIADAAGLPVAAFVESASPHEVKLVEDTIDSSFTQYAPDKLIGDKSYDSDKHNDQLLDERGVEMIAPHRKVRKKPNTQAGRKLRRYRRLWGRSSVCSFGWLQNYRRLIVRYEYHVENFLAMVQLGCIKILLRFF